MQNSPASRVFHSGFMRELIMGNKAKTLYPKRMNQFTKGLFKIRQLEFEKFAEESFTTDKGSVQFPNCDGAITSIKPRSEPTDPKAYGISHYGNTWYYIEIHDVIDTFDQKSFEANDGGNNEEWKRYLFEGTKIKFTLYDQAMKQKLNKTMVVSFQCQYRYSNPDSKTFTSDFVRGRVSSCHKHLIMSRPYRWKKEGRRELKLYQSVIGFGSKSAMCLSSLALEPTTKAQIERDNIETALYLVGSIGKKNVWEYIRNVHADVYKPKPLSELTINSKPHPQPPSHKPKPKLTKK